ncbi:hypothetical protein [Geobacillus jurassicus]|uniref:Uncharacterized protein n=1 Tax=Geobacillus jurassicus TaxID=235932 RepID=A0ABV6GUL5_9BACL|nr:hypothetical protein [Geobacillus jurassicus]
MRTIVYLLLACHVAVICYWISDWTVLTTPVGLAIWAGGIMASLVVLRVGRFMSTKQRTMLKTMTAASILLAVCSLLIEWAVRSMP